MSISDNIRRLRLARGWSRDYLCRASHTTSVSQIEGGKGARLETLEAIADALGVPLAALTIDPAQSRKILARLAELFATTSRRSRNG
jgi:transcriptional regulator with XRE-family HTH domain